MDLNIVSRVLCWETSWHTLRLFPVVSFSASNPPGPILLLRDFLLGFSIGVDLFPAATAPRSAVAFSWSISLEDGIWPNDFRDLGRDAGRVTSSREDMVAIELEAQFFVSRGLYGMLMKLADQGVILGSLLMVAAARKQNKAGASKGWVCRVAVIRPKNSSSL